MNGSVELNDIVLKGRLSIDHSIKGTIANTKKNLKASINIPISYEQYLGSYNITPSINEQILNTDNKLMKNDLTIKSIPYYEVSNPSNGETIVIGGDLGWL